MTDHNTGSETPRVYIHDSIREDDPDNAVFGEDTRGIVDTKKGGIIAYVHKDHADAFRRAWADHIRQTR